jgi:hypothetical protein
MATIRELIDDKINEVFYEHQKANGIISGDISVADALALDTLIGHLENLIEDICAKQPKQIYFDKLAPSWYIYTDYEGIAHSENFHGTDMDKFFCRVSKRIAFDDLDEITVQKIYFQGKEVEYAGWQPGMKFEYKDLDGNTIWVGYFEHWDH